MFELDSHQANPQHMHIVLRSGLQQFQKDVVEVLAMHTDNKTAFLVLQGIVSAPSCHW